MRQIQIGVFFAPEKDLEAVEGFGKKQNVFSVCYQNGIEALLATPTRQDQPFNEPATGQTETNFPLSGELFDELNRQVELETNKDALGEPLPRSI